MRKLAFYSFQEIAELFHVSPKTIANWSWKKYFKVTGYKRVSRGRRIALVSEVETKRLIGRFILGGGKMPGRKPGRKHYREMKSNRVAPQVGYNPPPWEIPVQPEMENTGIPPSEKTSPMQEESFTPIEKIAPSPLELITALLREGLFTPKEIHEETGFTISIVKETLSHLEEQGHVEKSPTGIADPDEWYCYTMRENHV